MAIEHIRQLQWAGQHEARAIKPVLCSIQKSQDTISLSPNIFCITVESVFGFC